jgi:hypothetical protein
MAFQAVAKQPTRMPELRISRVIVDVDTHPRGGLQVFQGQVTTHVEEQGRGARAIEKLSRRFIADDAALDPKLGANILEKYDAVGCRRSEQLDEEDIEAEAAKA